MITTRQLRSDAERLATRFPPLLADAERLAASVLIGTHGRRQPGRGDEFWQYRSAMFGDSARDIDWRRSARSDSQFVRQKEWQAAQSVWIWVDPGRSMSFASDSNLMTKSRRASTFALAMAILLVRAGERVGLLGSTQLAASTGEAHLEKIALSLDASGDQSDYASPDLSNVPTNARILLLSDFMADPASLERQISKASAKAIRGTMLQILDPQEADFPFSGRTIFESVGGAVEHETLMATDLRKAYLARLASRQDELAGIARACGWHFHTAQTNEAGPKDMLWLYRSIERRA